MEASVWSRQKFELRRLSDRDWDYLRELFPNPQTAPRRMIDALCDSGNEPLPQSFFRSRGEYLNTCDTINTKLRTATAKYKVGSVERGGARRILIAPKQRGKTPPAPGDLRDGWRN